MSANVGSVHWDMRAGSTNLGKDIDRAMGMAKKRLMSAGAAIGRTVTVALAAGTAAITAATIKGINSIDQLAKEADKLGIATEQLQLLRHAANLTGVEAGKLGTGLQRMTRRVAEAAQGTGEAVKALEELNLDARELNKLSPDQVFLRIGKAMQGVGNQSDRIRLAMKLFDSEGVGLVNTLRLTETELEGLRTELSALGVTLDRDAAARAEKAKDALTTLGMVGTGFSNSLAVEMAPAIELVAKKMTRMTMETGNFRSIIRSGIAAAVDSVGVFLDAFRDVEIILLTGQKGFAAIGQFAVVAADLAIGAWKKVESGLGLAVLGMELAWAKGLSKMGELVTDFAVTTAKGLDRLPFLEVDIPRLETDLAKVQGKLDGFLQANRIAFNRERNNFNGVMATGLEDQVITAVTRVEELQKAIDDLQMQPSTRARLNAQFKDFTISLDEAVIKTDSLTDKTNDLADDSEKAAKRLTEGWSSFAFNATSAIDRFVETGRFKVKDFVRDVIQDLAKIQLRNLFLGSDLTGGIFGGIAKSLKIPLTETIGKRLGGPVAAGQPVRVGEGGGELFVPDVSGNIVPNIQAQRLLDDSGGNTFIFNTEIPAGVTQKELALALQKSQEQNRINILEVVRNGGAAGRVFKTA